MGSFRPFTTTVNKIERIVSKVANLVIPSVVQCRMSAWELPGLITGLRPLLENVFNGLGFKVGGLYNRQKLYSVTTAAVGGAGLRFFKYVIFFYN